MDQACYREHTKPCLCMHEHGNGIDLNCVRGCGMCTLAVCEPQHTCEPHQSPVR